MNPSKSSRAGRRRRDEVNNRETYLPSYRKIEEYQKKKAEEGKE